jgi:hypothetical protein
MLNKKSQVGDTLTWFVATIIIIIILIIFIYFSSILSKAKNIEFEVKSISLSDGSETLVNLLGEKSNLAYKINNSNKDFIEEWINEQKG